MPVQTLLPDPKLVQLECVTSDEASLILIVRTIRTSVPCPNCAHAAQRIHSHYRRKVAHLPWNNVPVRLQIHSRRFFCDHRECPRQIFTEPLTGLASRYARRTLALAEILQLIGFALGGEAGARLAARLGLAASPDTLLGQLRRLDAEPPPPPKVLGVDDFAFRKGQRYGTILVDLERRRPIDLLPDRSAQTLAVWLQQHPEVQIVTRDRSYEFARGIALGAPHAVQVADRFHLLVNLREMLERVVERQRHRLTGVVLPQGTPEATEEAPVDPTVSRPRRPARRSAAVEAVRNARYQQRLALREQVQALHAAGESVLGIAQQLDLNRSTVYRYLRQSPESGAVRTHSVRSQLDPFLPYLSRRWSEGCHNGQQLWRELREQGYAGSRRMVALWAQQQRETPAPTTPKRYRTSPPPDRREEAPAAETARSAQLPSTRQVSWFLLREAASLSPAEHTVLAQLHQAAPELAVAQALVQEFQQLLRIQDLSGFHAWQARALASGLVDLRNFVNGLERDRAAVEAAFRLPWSNGPVEGQVNRLKLLKRQMYGRASFELLRARVLQAA